MQSGQIVVKWNAVGEIDIKVSLPIATGDNKKLAINVLLDAVRAINDTGTAALLPSGPRRILIGD